MTNGEAEALLIARVRAAARAEIEAFVAACEACSLSAPKCASLVRAWHALASLEAHLEGNSVESASEFVASFARPGRGPLPPVLRDVTDDFARVVIACAVSPPWLAVSAPSDHELDAHRRVLLRAFAKLNWRVWRRLPALGVPWRRVGAVAVVVTLAAGILFALYRPRWRVSYYANESLSGDPAVVTRDIRPDRNWGQGGPGAGLPSDYFSARFETCLVLKAPANVVFTVGSDDGTKLFVDERQVIDGWASQPYTVHQQSVALDKGVHSLRLDYYEHVAEARLTFDARVGGSTSDVDQMLHLPAEKGPPCGR